MKYKKRYFKHMSSVYRAIKRLRPSDTDIVVFRELIDGKIVFSVFL